MHSQPRAPWQEDVLRTARPRINHAADAESPIRHSRTVPDESDDATQGRDASADDGIDNRELVLGRPPLGDDQAMTEWSRDFVRQLTRSARRAKREASEPPQ